MDLNVLLARYTIPNKLQGGIQMIFVMTYIIASKNFFIKNSSAIESLEKPQTENNLLNKFNKINVKICTEKSLY